MKKFVLEGNYEKFLTGLGIDTSLALRKSGQREDLLHSANPQMTATAYFDFMDAVGAQMNDDSLAVKMGTDGEVQTFSPPIFAAYCSKDGLTFLKRMAMYKKLIGPIIILVEEYGDNVSVEFFVDGSDRPMPHFLILVEFVFITHILRKATTNLVIPRFVEMNGSLYSNDVEKYLQCKVQSGEKNCIVFKRNDVFLPFVTRNDAMWSYFEPELRRHLADLNANEGISARLRSVLIELLPGGTSSIDDAAHKLGISRRTLQRRLNDENTTFQQQLNHTRKLLAIHYLKKSDMTCDDIAYLLGYCEFTSFLRAFKNWTGKNPSDYRKMINDE